jgi:ribosomal protein S18 acetylase RimI-like enzyme
MTAQPIGRELAIACPDASVAVRIRTATPADIPALMRAKHELARLDDTDIAVIAGEDDWRRDGFGPQARFFSLVAEQEGLVIGMLTCSERYFTGWVGPTFVIQDLYVDAEHRNRGIGRALLAQVAALARDRGVPLIELTVRADNPARRFYGLLGLQPVRNCLPYVLVGQALSELAAGAADVLTMGVV